MVVWTPGRRERRQRVSYIKVLIAFTQWVSPKSSDTQVIFTELGSTELVR